MTKSRVEAVARAMEARADDLFAYRDNHHGIDAQTWQQLAQAAIAANDAWLLPDDVSEHTRNEYLETIAGIERVRSALKALGR